MAERTTREETVSIFEAFSSQLDDHNDRRERLIKSSRDVTNLSKKVIFLLHRIMTDDSSPDANNDSARAKRAISAARGKLKEIQNLFADLKHDLVGDLFWRYQRNVSPGIQEYIEALSFSYYLETSKLISFSQVQNTLSGDDGVPFFPLTLEDYLLGLSDLTGELMRYAISAISQSGGRHKAAAVCTFVRSCRADFEALTPHFRELRKKQAVTLQSLQKIENATYAIAVRSSEYDLPPEILDDLVARAVASTRGDTSDMKRKRGHEEEIDQED